ncbi:uncharacterized protein A1O9_09823 [Exophiala aquamarina CBS 119918]|uniref:Peptidase S8/S53 domain-containing protein n=1 Tax=Exophiala aquamarina CBS 119918 TaxID=1182545 RepID=A0A072P425_9EURO|nr:uncharacterized protein A1O9_09823 [Exophiala aquamarina CBS 119918]KEF54028.1 hypothetical protein A1O9_09823 [Exophiala aquamarina CBS 119918]
MASTIVLNGKSVAKSALEKDASASNYILIQTTGDPLDNTQKKKLKDLGVQIQEFVGDEEGSQLYLCGYKEEPLDVIRDLDFVDYANVYVNDFVVPADTLPPSGRQTADADASHKVIVDVDVLLHHDVKDLGSGLVRQIADAANVETHEITAESGVLRLKVDLNNLGRIAAIDEVRVIHPVKERKLFNNVARKLLNADDVKLNDTTYQGEGQIVAVADTGFDRGSVTDTHEAFDGRVVKLIPLGRPPRGSTRGKADDPDGHGTHVCGSVLGSGSSSSEGKIEGTAPGAELIVQSLLSKLGPQAQLGGIPRDLGDLFNQAYMLDARVHTNSWGTPLDEDSGIQNPYDGGAEGIDNFVWNNQDMTILFAAGNDGQDKGPGRSMDGKINERSLGAEVAAKNCITVGATENLRPDLNSGVQGVPYTYGAFWRDSFPKNPLKDDLMANNPEGLAAFSSRGPTAENRLKPDVVAPGTAILSTRSRNIVNTADIGDFGAVSDSKYFYLAGTSMATPLVAGCCAVIRETLVKNGYEDVTNGVKNPTGSLVKALLVNGAVPIHGQYMPKEVGDEPNPHSGFGRVNLAGSISLPGDRSTGYGIGIISDSRQPFEVSVPVPSASALAQQVPNGQTNPGSSPAGLTLKVTLAYADFPGARLSNDLNLIIVAGDKERHGNQWNAEFEIGSHQPFDRRNNVEQIVWANVPGDHVKIVIKGWRLTSDEIPFAYAWKFF